MKQILLIIFLLSTALFSQNRVLYTTSGKALIRDSLTVERQARATADNLRLLKAAFNDSLLTYGYQTATQVKTIISDSISVERVARAGADAALQDSVTYHWQQILYHAIRINALESIAETGLIDRVSTLETNLEILEQAFYDSITALSSRIGFITPTFPDEPTGLLAVGRTTDILVNWMDYTMSVAPDSFEISISNTNPSLGGDPIITSVYTTDTFYVHTGIPTNTVYWYYVKAWLDNEFSSISNIDSAFVYEGSGGSGSEGENGWFATKDGTGDKSGTSWYNAWDYPTVNFATMVSGDTLYLSGGADSVVYNDEITLTKSGITITKGLSAGHNGKVIIQAAGADTMSGTAFTIRDVNNVTVSEITINNWAMGFEIDGNSANSLYNITIDGVDGIFNGRFLRAGGYPDITGSYCHDVIVKNCTLTTPTTTGLQTDFVYFQYMGQPTVENNDVTIRSNDITQHNDMVQTFWVDGDVIVRNNIFKNLNNKQPNSQGIFFENHQGNYYVYNNIVVQFGDTTNDGNTGGKIYFKDSSVDEAVAYVYGNTVYGSNGDFVLLNTSSTGSMIKNNILWTFGRIGGTLSTTSIIRVYLNSGTTIANNLFYDKDNTMTNYSNSGTNGTNYEADPLFTDRFNLDFTLQSTSPAINVGATLGSPYNIDILGITRPVGAGYEIGCYEYNP